MREQTITFFTKAHFWFFFFKIMLESWGCGLYTSAAYTRVFTVCLDHHKNLSVIYDFSSGVSRPKRSSSVCTFVGLNLFPSRQQEILRIPMFRNPHVPFSSRVFLSDYETSIHCVPTLLTSFMFNWVNGPVAV